MEALPSPKSENKASSKFQLLFKEVKILQSKGLSIREISRRLEINRKTVTRYFKYDVYTTRASIQSNHNLEAYKKILLEKWKEEGVTRLDLWQGLHKKGSRGSLTTFYRKFKALIGSSTLTKKKVQAPKIKIWSSRKMSFLLSRESDMLKPDELNYLETLSKISSKIQLSAQLARQFNNMVSNRENDKLDDWINRTSESGIAALKNFAVGLQSDY